MTMLIRNVGKIVGAVRAEYRQIFNRYFGTIERFDGNAEEICKQIVEKLWEGDFYRTSLGHFDFFWMRDFGTVCESLVKTGYKKHTLHTLKWAMLHFRRAGLVRLCIDKAGNTFDAPSPSIDALPWLLHCLVVSNYDLTKVERTFLRDQLVLHRNKYLDDNGNVKSMKFAEMRDAVMYDRSAYAVALVGRMAYCVEQLGLEGFEFPSLQYKDELINNYWNGAYFNADRKTDAFSAECALFPFWLGLIEDSDMMQKTFEYIEKAKLNQPFPLIYTNREDAFRYHWWMTHPIMPHYEGHSLWSWHGVFYLHLLKRYGDPAYQAQKEAFAKGMIEKHGTFPEMLSSDGSWYYSSIYRGDPGMVWAALYVELDAPLLI